VLAFVQQYFNPLLQMLHCNIWSDELAVHSGYGVTPTAKARALWPDVQQALMQIRNTLVPNDFDPASASNSFVVSMADATATMPIPDLIRTIQAEAPGLLIRIVPLTTRDRRSLPENNEIDMAIGYFPRTVAAITLPAKWPQANSTTPLLSTMTPRASTCARKRSRPGASFHI